MQKDYVCLWLLDGSWRPRSGEYSKMLAVVERPQLIDYLRRATGVLLCGGSAGGAWESGDKMTDTTVKHAHRWLNFCFHHAR
jgi:hypothetical protein